MIAHTWLDHLPIWLVFVATIVVALAALEGGYRIGRARRASASKEKEGAVGASVSAGLGLLALLLAFVFGYAANRFDDRRRLVIDEANAVGTCYLRAAMLPEPHRGEVRRLLREYVDARIAAVKDPDEMAPMVRRSLEIQDELWKHATAVAEKDARSVPYGLFVESLNLVIDFHSERLASGARTRLPGRVWSILFTLVVFSFGAMGYHVGLADSTRSPALAVVAFVFALTIWLVVDLERPYGGALRVSQQPMIDLRDSMVEMKP